VSLVLRLLLLQLLGLMLSCLRQLALLTLAPLAGTAARPPCPQAGAATRG
jgi:hypothetical protein